MGLHKENLRESNRILKILQLYFSKHGLTLVDIVCRGDESMTAL